jgi:hypothetical protein
METLEFYVVRNKQGKFLRSKGYSGYGESWVNELKKAKVYTKKGSASAQITFWATNYPEYGVPELVPLVVTLGIAISQEDRIKKVMKKKEIEKAREELYKAQDKYDKSKREVERINGRNAELNLAFAETSLRKAEQKLEELKNS